ncbi:MAG: hypothetical protein ACLS9F_13930 [Clostridium paraputrificum]
MEEVEQILQDFTKALETTVFAVEINGIKREATPEDQVDFIKNAWEEASEQLYELGVETNY